jgi:hypothetical protein
MKLATALVVAGLGVASAQDTAPPTAPAPPAEAPAPSPWYADRGSQPREPGPLDPVPDTAFRLALLLRDGGVPGFYDGQFASVADRFDDLSRLAIDPDMNHVLRIMAIMALQEAGSGAPVVAALDPLVIPAHEELAIDLDVWRAAGRRDDESFVQSVQRADLSEHARFALAKDGEPQRVLEKIREMDRWVSRKMADILDPTLDSDNDPDVAWLRQLVFDIGYHYQQFDDFDHASEWFRKLTDALPGHRETRWAHYNLACIAALQGKPDEAMDHLKAAWAVGFADVSWMLEDGDLRSLRERPDFQALVQTIRGQVPAGEEPGARGPRRPAESPKGPN